MIKLDRQPEPQVVTDNGATWLAELTAAIAVYGAMNKIPKDEKSKLMVHYKHPDIKDALLKGSNKKCAFCECIPEGGHMEVEHFQPSSIYPQLSFVWTNLLPSCEKCNGLKLAHDTGLQPIINPFESDPATCFEYEGMRMRPKAGLNFDISKLTIDVCGLDKMHLWKPRSDILVALYGYTDTIKEAIDELNDANTDRKRELRLRKLAASILTIETLSCPKRKFSAFCKDYLENCAEYIEAKRIIAAAVV